jgi:hypothetical protein
MNPSVVSVLASWSVVNNASLMAMEEDWLIDSAPQDWAAIEPRSSVFEVLLERPQDFRQLLRMSIEEATDLVDILGLKESRHWKLSPFER